MKEITFTDWTGTHKAKLIIPNKIDSEFKLTIIRFFLELDDHDAIDECREVWGITKENWDDICLNV